MKEDFTHAKEELQRIGIKRVAADFYAEPKRKGSVFFVKSPATTDKHESLALYPGSNRFVDFANGGHSGDVVGFVSYIRGCNNWQALKELQSYYGLADARKRDRQEIRRKIQRQRQQEQEKRQRQQAFKTALFGRTDDLQRWANIYRLALKNRLYEPFSDMWCYIMDELQQTQYKLDILCSSNQSEYRFMKYSDRLPSDYPQWLLDSLAILEECGAFQPTREEVKEITAQRNYELTRKPGGAVRRCEIEW